MSARSVCSGTRPSRYHSYRAISAPPRRPEQATRIPLAPNFCAVWMAFFIARLKAMRRSSCVVMFSAASCASVSALRTSTMLRKTSFCVNCCSSFLMLSMPTPRLPITMPGRAVCTLTFTLLAARSISTLLMPAWPGFFFTYSRRRMSSWRHLAQFLSSHHFESQERMTRRRPVIGMGEVGERPVGVLAAAEVRPHAHLAGRDAEVSEGCLGFHVSSPLLRGRRGRGGGGRRSRSSRGPGHGGAGLGFLVAGVAVERAGGSELAQLVADHVLGHEHRDELAPVVHRERVPHQVGKDGRAARPRLHHLLLALPVHVLHLLDQVAVDERALLDRTCHQRTPLSRRLMMNLLVRLLTRVLYPLVGWPQGETGCGLPWPLLPSPPPCG